MSPAHLDRLSATDASFLSQESDSAHMHIGAVLVFEGPPPSYDEFVEHIAARLHLVPRFRQKLAFPPLQSGKPVWVDDPRLNLEYHVRHSSLPAPGDDDQLSLLTGRLFSQQLDRSKPLWEMYLVQGLEGNRFALISKTHHALVDGISGVDLATVLFDANPVRPGSFPPCGHGSRSLSRATWRCSPAGSRASPRCPCGSAAGCCIPRSTRARRPSR